MKNYSLLVYCVFAAFVLVGCDSDLATVSGPEAASEAGSYDNLFCDDAVADSGGSTQTGELHLQICDSFGGTPLVEGTPDRVLVKARNLATGQTISGYSGTTECYAGESNWTAHDEGGSNTAYNIACADNITGGTLHFGETYMVSTGGGNSTSLRNRFLVVFHGTGTPDTRAVWYDFEFTDVTPLLPANADVFFPSASNWSTMPKSSDVKSCDVDVVSTATISGTTYLYLDILSGSPPCNNINTVPPEIETLCAVDATPLIDLNIALPATGTSDIMAGLHLTTYNSNPDEEGECVGKIYGWSS